MFENWYTLYYQNGLKKFYDGYDQKNQKTVKLLLEKFINHKNNFNDLSHIKDVYETIFEIEKKIN